MSERKNPRDRSVSGDVEDSDFESHDGEAAANPGKPGRKKNPNSQSARRDQNRIAQREFRQRKQQRIRDLEARVEILSGGHDQALTELRNILKDLMAENQTLRGLVRSLAAFIGDGAGGLLPKLGWDTADFNSFINRTETDTAWESFQRRKKQNNAQPSSSTSFPGQGSKRAAEDDRDANPTKKARGMNDRNADSERSQNGYPLIVPVETGIPGSVFPSPRPSTSSQNGNGIFSDLMRNGSPLFAHPSPPTNVAGPFNGPMPPHANSYQNSFSPNLGIPFRGANSSESLASGSQSASLQAEQIEEDEPQKNEANKLIRYHLDNYTRNAAYCLPASLRPTLVQRTIPHESVIDGIIHPELRDRMILLRNKFDLVDCLIEYKRSVTIHGDDVLAHSNWEIGEKWLRQFGFLVEQPTLNIINKWRLERGDPELHLSDIVPQDSTPAS
ncbi:hypothetical protein ONZ45_g17338 [Pleurotus djamor]|nr:hypothetical protein ONZ45_g17338 [Pleurotus djamor]